MFSVAMRCSISAAAKSDSIEDALDYAAVSECIQSIVQGSTCKLLEPLLERIAVELFRSFGKIDALTLTVRKPQAIASAECAGLTISRTRTEASCD